MSFYTEISGYCIIEFATFSAIFAAAKITLFGAQYFQDTMSIDNNATMRTVSESTPRVN